MVGDSSLSIYYTNDERRRMMNRYLMGIQKWTHAEYTFVIEANNKEDAVIKGKAFANRDPEFGFGGNYKLDTVRVIKKLQKKGGKNSGIP